MHSKGGGIVRDTHDDRAAVVDRIVNSIGDGNTCRVGAEVVIEDLPGTSFPGGTRIFEVADQFPFLGVDANDWKAAAAELLSEIGNVFELEVTVWTGISRDLFPVHAKRIAQLMQ